MCSNDLYSDAEDDNEKNVGCDQCPPWFHVKCTKFIGKYYTDISNEPLTCFLCSR